MLFNSQIFIFVFLPVVWIGYYGFHKFGMHECAKIWLLLSSFLFYGYNNPKYVWLLLGSILGNYFIYYLFGLADAKHLNHRKLRKTLLLFGGGVKSVFAVCL